MKTVLFVPGNGETLTSRDYRAVLDAIEKKGYQTRFVPIKWARTTVKQWVNQLLDEYKLYEPSDTVLAGFSFGALTAFVTACQIQPAELWLFSLSPYFAEDFPRLKPAYFNRMGKRRTAEFKKLSFNKLAPHISCKTLLFAGEIELAKYPSTQYRYNDASRKVTSSTKIIVPNCSHDVSDPNYIHAIAQNI